MTNTVDHVAGFCTRGKKWNPATKTEEPAGFLNLYIYKTNPATEEPEVTGKYKGEDGKEYPQYTITDGLRIPLSTLAALAQGEKKRITVFRSERPKTANATIAELKAKIAELEKKA